METAEKRGVRKGNRGWRVGERDGESPKIVKRMER